MNEHEAREWYTANWDAEARRAELEAVRADGERQRAELEAGAADLKAWIAENGEPF